MNKRSQRLNPNVAKMAWFFTHCHVRGSPSAIQTVLRLGYQVYQRHYPRFVELQDGRRYLCRRHWAQRGRLLFWRGNQARSEWSTRGQPLNRDKIEEVTSCSFDKIWPLWYATFMQKNMNRRPYPRFQVLSKNYGLWWWKYNPSRHDLNQEGED